MVLEAIYVVRHGYRLNWVVNAATGTYHSAMPTPTGIPADPTLASYGEVQAEHLGKKIASLDPPVDVVYSSPFYRCLQTIRPAVRELRAAGKKDLTVRVENGIGEFFGTARFEHPAPATLAVLHTHFDFLNDSHKACIIPSANGETLPALHDRLAYAMHCIISDLDADPNGPKAVVLCSHAASIICIGRVLTGRMPPNVEDHDFHCGTCSLSKYVRRRPTAKSETQVPRWDSSSPDKIPAVDWRNGNGVGGGWDCLLNGDCSFLPNGEERSWAFSGDESFLDDHEAPSDDAHILKQTPKGQPSKL